MRHPETFVITPHFLHSPEDGLSAIQLDKRKAMRAKDATLREEFSANGMGGCWIIKDAQGAKGDNIAVCEGVANALAEVDGGAHQTACVVQRYIRAPLLLPCGRKFDVRCWVLFSPSLRVYMHRQVWCAKRSVAEARAAVATPVATILLLPSRLLLHRCHDFRLLSAQLVITLS